MEPAKLKALRLSRGLSLRELAKKVGVSHTFLHLIETGERTPKEELLKKILDALSASYLLNTPHVPYIRPFYRVEKDIEKRYLSTVEKEVLDLLSIYLEIEDLAKKTNILPLEVERHPIFTSKYSAYSLEEVEDIAEKVRETLSIGTDPIRNVTALLEDLHIRIIYVDGYKDFWAMAFEMDDGLPVIALRRGIAGDRGRFSLAHELGHILIQPKAKLDMELTCHRFAGAFLFPKEKVIKQFGKKRSSISLEELKIAKFKYGISMASILHRLLDLNIITKKLYNTYRNEFSQKGWLIREPVELEKESPLRIKQLLLVLEKEGVIDVRTRMDYQYKLFGVWET